MIAMSEPIFERILNLSESQIPLITAFLDTLSDEKASKKSVSNRIGIAKNISFPADFDDIDYGTADFFGLNV